MTIETLPTRIKHLAIIMDGNSRWATDNNLTTAQGHSRGAENAKEVLSSTIEFGIPYLTLYAFSSENWQRSEEEITVLMNLLSYYLKKETNLLTKNGIRLKVIGQINRLSPDLQQKIEQVIKLTKDNNKMTLSIALSYGGRLEIVDACQKIINSGKKRISEEEFKNYLYDPEMPNVDLLIRTSGELRISNFLIWQTAYAELYFCQKNWPDFSKKDLTEAINDYATRKRTFGNR
jgi:undecaprenyl diphosphate synthase